MNCCRARAIESGSAASVGLAGGRTDGGSAVEERLNRAPRLLRSGGVAAAAAAAAVGTSVVTARPAAAWPTPSSPSTSRSDPSASTTPATRAGASVIKPDEEPPGRRCLPRGPGLLLQRHAHVVPWGPRGTCRCSPETSRGTARPASTGTSQGQTIANNAYTWPRRRGRHDQRAVRNLGWRGGTHFILDLVAILMIVDFGPEPLNP